MTESDIKAAFKVLAKEVEEAKSDKGDDDSDKVKEFSDSPDSTALATICAPILSDRMLAFRPHLE